MSGSVSVVRQLLAAGLLDELHLLVHPGRGRPTRTPARRLRPVGVPLRLLSAQTFTTGVLNPAYAPAEAPQAKGSDEAKAHLAAQR